LELPGGEVGGDHTQVCVELKKMLKGLLKEGVGNYFMGFWRRFWAVGCQGVRSRVE